MPVLQLWITHDDYQLRPVPAEGGGDQAARLSAVSLGIELEALAARVLRHTPPTGAQMEQAIMELEDAIAPHIALARACHALPLQVMGDAWAQPLLQQMRGLSPAHVVSTPQWEQVFERLTRLVEGAPIASAGVPLEMPLWVAVVLVRELLHHAGFAQVQIG